MTVVALALAYLMLIVAFLMMCHKVVVLEKRVKLLEEGEE